MDRLKACLQSLAGQDDKNYEVILVNDGGSLDLDSFCKKYVSRSDLFCVINQDNGGVSAARNAGIEKMSGDYVCFCDADDYVSSDFLSELRRCAEEADLGICGVTEQHFPVISSEIQIGEFWATPYVYNQIQYVNFCVNKIYKAEIIQNENIRFDDSVKLGEDALFVADYLLHCQRIKTIGKNLYHYMPNEKSAVNAYCSEFWDWEKRIMDRQFRQFNSQKLDTRGRQYMKYWAFCKIRQILNYYGRQEADEKARNKVLREVQSSEVCRYLLDYPVCKGNLFFHPLDVIQLVMWELLGLRQSMRLKNCIRKFVY